MANGTLGQSLLATATYTTVYTVPASATNAAISIAFCNTGLQDAYIQLSISSSSTPAPGEFIEYNSFLPAFSGVLERTGVVVSTGKKIVAYSSVSGMNVNVYGYEQSI